MLLKRRIEETLSNFNAIYGCYVNAGTIVSTMRIPVLDMTDEEKSLYAKIFKKSISGKLGKNILNIELKKSEDMRSLSLDPDIRTSFFETIINSLDTNKNYCILMAFDTYETEEEMTKYFIHFSPEKW